MRYWPRDLKNMSPLYSNDWPSERNVTCRTYRPSNATSLVLSQLFNSWLCDTAQLQVWLHQATAEESRPRRCRRQILSADNHVRQSSLMLRERLVALQLVKYLTENGLLL